MEKNLILKILKWFLDLNFNKKYFEETERTNLKRNIKNRFLQFCF